MQGERAARAQQPGLLWVWVVLVVGVHAGLWMLWCSQGFGLPGGLACQGWGAVRTWAWVWVVQVRMLLVRVRARVMLVRVLLVRVLRVQVLFARVVRVQVVVRC